MGGMRLLAALLALSIPFLVACEGPTAVFPGGALTGPVEPAPASFAFARDAGTVQLETRPEDPYSVNVWAVAVGDHLYIAAGDSENAWASYIRSDPRVRVKMGEDVYALRATPTADQPELDAFLAAAVTKYDFDPDPEQQDKAMLFRLEPR
jgi:hypothetical protein